MKVIIAGSRNITDYEIVEEAVEESGFEITEVVSGKARGVDQLGERYAENHDLPVADFPAEWHKYSKGAGYRRNSLMGNYADALVAIWDGKSKGTRHMIHIMKKKGKPAYVKRADPTYDTGWRSEDIKGI